MTVIVGFVSPDGAVMASDSEGTESDQTRGDVDKISACGSLVIAFTGVSSVEQPLRASLTSSVPKVEGAGPLGRWDMRAAICTACGPVFQSAVDNHVPKPPQGVIPGEIATTLLAIGRDDDGYWLLEVDPFNRPSFYDGFHALGSGSVAAQVAQGILANYEPLGRSVPHLRLIAYRTLKTCISVLGGTHGVGGEVRMWQSEGGSPFAKLDASELVRVKDGVEKWEKLEVESLDRVLLEESEPEGDKLPEDLEGEKES